MIPVPIRKFKTNLTPNLSYSSEIRTHKRGFTLIELLVVIAISAVLFTLLLDPLINSFRLTQRAQMIAAAQDSARITMENLTRELKRAVYIFDNNTHPFTVNVQPTSTLQNLSFTNFLVLDTPKQIGNAKPIMTPALAFNAKLDFVLPRHNANGQLVDPTTGEPMTVKDGSAIATGLTFPFAPGTTMDRYWVGLKDPTQSYSPYGEGTSLVGKSDNTYILYRAQFSPFNSVDPNTGKTEVINNSTVNELLFNPKMVNGNPTNTPEFDDPNFFRTVTTSDTNWLDPNHASYTSAQVTAHNAIVANWMKIAKPVITSPNIDLILLLHNSDNTITYDSAPGALNGVAHSGAIQDPVTGTEWPIVNTSVTFGLASVTSDATAATTTNHSGIGYGGDVTATNSGMPYVPSVYTANDQSWAFPYHISLYQYYQTTTPLFVTDVAPQTTGNITDGDLIEEMYNAGTPSPVYDVTTGNTIATNGNYVPLSVNPDTGSINFSMPALPTPTNPYQRYWSLPSNGFNGNPDIDLSILSNSPLPTVPPDGSTTTPPALTGDQVANARVVPGSIRIYGPDAQPGPDQGHSILYTEVPQSEPNFGPDEYMVDYAHNMITMYIDPGTKQLPINAVTGYQDPVQIAFNYQANMQPVNPQLVSSVSNPINPLVVKVDYQTRDLLDINLGVRIYDPNNVGPAQLVTVHNQVHIANSNT